MQPIVHQRSFIESKLNIKKTTLEWIGIFGLLVFSFFNEITLVISLGLLLLFLFQKEIGALKIINLITLRTIINPGIGLDIYNAQNFKWLILFGCSIYLIFAYFKLEKEIKSKLDRIIFFIFLFSIFNIFVAIFFSSLPTIAIFKLASYVVIFTGTLIGIGYTIANFNWTKWLLNLFYLIMIFSFFIMPYSVSVLRNGTSFQGVTNHPNMFGILSVLFLALFFSYSNIHIKKGIIHKFLLPIVTFGTLYLVILSKSRTAFISCLIIVALYLIIFKKNNYNKVIINFYFLTSIFLLLTISSLKDFLIEFLYKTQDTGNLLSSRMGQIESLTTNFINSPLFGNGFAVPVLSFKSYSFSSSFIVEPGNLFLAVLSYNGIIGGIIFLGLLLQIFLANKKMFIINGLLPISVLLISMGEMVFFSSNNIGIWCYMFLAIYIFNDREHIQD